MSFVPDNYNACMKQQIVYNSQIFDTSTQNLFALLPLIYAIPSIVCGVIILILLCSKQGRAHFNGPFYFFYKVSIIVVRLKKVWPSLF